jgi:phosphotransferase family enzyme
VSVSDLLSAVPSRVLARLGRAPEELGRFGSSRVVRGEGVVLKVGPTDRAAREAFMLAEIGGLPLAVPSLLDAGDGWLLLEEVDSISHFEGSERDDALADLARLHDVFAGGALLSDRRLRDVTGYELPGLRERSMRLARDLVLPEPLRALATDPEPLLTHLRDANTLLHGDAWPGNVLPLPGGGRCWIDWEEAGTGHAALDLANWLYGSPWVPPAPDPNHDLATYLSARTSPIDGREFRLAVDCAVVLLFLLLDLPGLAGWEDREGRVLIEERAATAGRLVG